jgi:hypothetical protein
LSWIESGWTANRASAAIYLRDHAVANETKVAVYQALFSKERIRSSILTTGPIRYKQGIARGLTPEAARRKMAQAVAGSSFRHSFNGSRDTVMATVNRAHNVLGYRRISDGNPCAFCAMLIGRGAVYSKETVAFQAHDHDGCSPEPLYKKGSEEPAKARALAQMWVDSGAQSLSGKAAIAKFREYYAAHKPT